MEAKREKQTPMQKLTQKYDEFIKGKEINQNGAKLFERAIKKAAKSKQRGSK